MHDCVILSSHVYFQQNSTRMAGESPIQISDLIDHYEIKEAQLKNEFSNIHLASLARSGNFQWRKWAGQFRLSDQQIKDIDSEVDVCLDGVEKAQKALNMWHDRLGFTATYRKLVEIFLKNGNAKLAGEVCELLKGM